MSSFNSLMDEDGKDLHRPRGNRSNIYEDKWYIILGTEWHHAIQARGFVIQIEQRGSQTHGSDGWNLIYT